MSRKMVSGGAVGIVGQWESGIGFLGLTGPPGRKVLKFDGPLARGLWYRRFAAMNFIVSVTGYTVKSQILHDGVR